MSNTQLNQDTVVSMSTVTVLILSYFIGLKFIVTVLCGYLLKYNSKVAWMRFLFMISWYLQGFMSTVFCCFTLLLYETVVHRNEIILLCIRLDRFAISLNNLSKVNKDKNIMTPLISLAECWLSIKTQLLILINRIVDNGIYISFTHIYGFLSSNLHRLDPVMWSIGNYVNTSIIRIPIIGYYYDGISTMYNGCKIALSSEAFKDTSKDGTNDTLLVNNSKSYVLSLYSVITNILSSDEGQNLMMDEVIKIYNELTGLLSEVKAKED